MAISIKNSQQIQYMREANQIVKRTHDLLAKNIRVGITTGELDAMAEEYIRSQGAAPSFKGYKGSSDRGFPGSICVSINSEVIHGIPGIKKLKDGDIVSIDIGAYKNGYHGDAARTHAVGEIAPIHKKLIEATERSFFEAIKHARDGKHLHAICAAVQAAAEAEGFSVVREYIGHGVGTQMHEDQAIPNTAQKGRGPRLLKGMTLAIEPMVNEGGPDIRVKSDHWTVVTKDGKYSAHYENTILITDGEPEILSL